jgi:hypothetical protein
MVKLPIRPRRVDLMSFWLTMSLLFGLMTAILLWIIQSAGWAVLGVIAAFILALPGLLYPRSIHLPYRIWNKAARTVAQVGTIFLQGVCFYIVFFAVGRAGSRLMLDLSLSRKTVWRERRTLEPTMYFSPHTGIENRGTSEKGWVLNYISWSVRSGNFWACCLLPFLIVLSLLEAGKKESRSPHIYSLY